VKQLMLALQFLTILPVRITGPVTDKELSGSAVFFPFAGAVQGIMAVSVGLLSGSIFSSEITAALVLLVLIISNGGFHLDGLADTFDALSVKSGGDPAADRDRKLSIMRDSTTGAIGVAAIVMAILLKFVFLVQVLGSIPQQGLYVFLFLMPVFSKWAMVLMMQLGASARMDGLGKIFIKESTLSRFFISSLLLAGLSAAAGFFFPGEYTIVLGMLIVISAVLILFCFVSGKFFENAFGGLTGDTLGAAGEISEILFLMVTAVWLQLFI
jgi:adenosylcobinamide-GDP ribazoletransferase